MREEIDKAVKQGKADSEIGLDELAADIYAVNLEGPIRGVTSLDSIDHKNVGSRVNFN